MVPMAPSSTRMRSAASDWTSLRVLPADNLVIARATCSGLFPLPFGERVRVRGNGFQCVENAFQNTIHVPKHIIVPKSHDQIALRFQRRRTLSILIGTFSVLATVELNDQPPRLTTEVCDV